MLHFQLYFAQRDLASGQFILQDSLLLAQVFEFGFPFSQTLGILLKTILDSILALRLLIPSPQQDIHFDAVALHGLLQLLSFLNRFLLLLPQTEQTPLRFLT